MVAERAMTRFKAAILNQTAQPKTAELPSKRPCVAGLSVDESCIYLGVKRTLLYKLINSERLQPVKLGMRTIIPLHQLESLLNPPEQEQLSVTSTAEKTLGAGRFAQ